MGLSNTAAQKQTPMRAQRRTRPKNDAILFCGRLKGFRQTLATGFFDKTELEREKFSSAL
jgi:hypothetical protein